MEEQEKTQQQTDRSRYRSSFAATVLFSSVQVFQIIISIIKSKFVALFIGPVGMGIQSLYQSTTDTISASTNLGLNKSSVKTIAAAKRDGNGLIISQNVTALRRLTLLTGLLGMVVCAGLSSLWSQASFGNNDYVWPFVVLSTIVLFDQLNKGELALLQGLQQRKELAKANIIGQSLNALITIPLYYYYGVDAIVAAFVMGSIIAYLISRFFTRKLSLEKVPMSWRETVLYGKEMIHLGFFLSLQYLLATVVMWIIRNYVSNVGGLDEVGLYSAGTAIVTNYIGLVFAAIATDYFPRLAATNNNEEMNNAVGTQAELTILLLAPLVIAFLVFIKPVIILLYSDKFLPIENMMYWAVSAVVIQAMGWALSYTLLAKAKPYYFFLNELFSTAWGLPIKLLCYKYWGLTGFGVATFVVYALYLIQVLVVTRKLFGVSFKGSLWKLFVILYIPILLVVAIKIILPINICYVVGGAILIVVCYLSLYILNKKMDIKSTIVARIKNK